MERTLELTLKLVSDTEFEVQIYQPETGDYCDFVCHDEMTDDEKNKLLDEIVSWVDILREETIFESESNKTEGFNALKIAETFLCEMNPVNWDGQGNVPVGVDTRIMTFPLTEDIELDISFELDVQDGWVHYCELRDKFNGDLIDCLSGYGVDSPQNLADTIMDLIKYLDQESEDE